MSVIVRGMWDLTATARTKSASSAFRCSTRPARTDRYRFSDFAPHGEADYGAYWQAMGRGRDCRGAVRHLLGRRRDVLPTSHPIPHTDP